VLLTAWLIALWGWRHTLIALALLHLLLCEPLHAWLLFVVLYGLGNGMLTIVRGTVIAQYANREQVASLVGALGVPRAQRFALRAPE
jgi:hypothetical protein